MKRINITELAPLPDVAVQPLVHPLDLPEARGPAYALSVAAGPPVAACLAAVLWFATASVVVPLIAFAALTGFGRLARLQYEQRAWSYIPRRRQDRDRTPPLSWDLAGAVITAALLGAALLLVAQRLTLPDVSGDVRDVTVGAGIAVAALMLLQLVIVLVRSRRHALLTLPSVAVVVAVVSLSYQRLYPAGAAPSTALLAWGAAAIAAAGVLVLLGRLLGSHARTNGERSAGEV